MHQKENWPRVIGEKRDIQPIADAWPPRRCREKKDPGARQRDMGERPGKQRGKAGLSIAVNPPGGSSSFPERFPVTPASTPAAEIDVRANNIEGTGHSTVQQPR